jgi:F-type H+-transporting ATPase subunit b
VKPALSCAFLLLFLLAAPFLLAQGHGAATPEQAGQSAETQQAPESRGAEAALAHESQEAAGEDADPHAEFKQSPSVKFIARITGLSLKAAYWLLVLLNFAIVAGVVGWAMKTNLPGAFRARTESIRKSMDEARKASEDANRRLSEIEHRLSRLDSEIADIRKKSEADAAAEEVRIRASAEDDRKKIVELTEQEIDAAARAARRELKAFTADLAVSLAEKKIKVDARTDEALVQAFVGQLGKDGR